MVNLSKKDLDLLKEKNISFLNGYLYSDDEIMEIADKVRDLEIMYSQMDDEKSRILADEYGKIADIIDSM